MLDSRSDDPRFLIIYQQEGEGIAEHRAHMLGLVRKGSE